MKKLCLSVIACALMAGTVFAFPPPPPQVNLTIRGSFFNPEGGFVCPGKAPSPLCSPPMSQGFGSYSSSVWPSTGYVFYVLAFKEMDPKNANITLDGTCSALGGQISFAVGKYPALRVLIPSQMVQNNSFSLNFKFIPYGSGWRFQCQPT